MAFLKNVAARRSMFSVVTYDVYLTDKRMVFVHSKHFRHGTSVVAVAGGAVGGMVGGLITGAVQSVLESKKQDKKEINALDELLAKDKENFEVPYANMDKIKLYKFRVGVNWKYMMAVYSNKTPNPFGLAFEQSDQLSKVLPTIAMLKGKTEIEN